MPGITSFGQFDITKGSCISSPVVMNSLNSGSGSLRQALLDACPSDTITFNIAIDNNTVLLNTIQLDIDKDVYIKGNGIQNTMLSGNNSQRIFRILDSETNVGIDNITFQNAYDSMNGGAIYNKGKLNLKDCLFRSNYELSVPKVITNMGEITLKGIVEVEE